MQILTYTILMLAAFYLMAKIVDDFFIVSLDNISKSLKLTPSVAGATLMAMGTSAPELSTALIALFSADANPATGVGTIVGSAIFQILVVIGFAAFVKTSYLNWKPVIRDGLFYAVTVFLLVLFVRDGVFTLFEASILVGTYLVYLAILFVWVKVVDEEGEPDPIELVTHPKKNGFWKIAYVAKKPVDYIFSFMPDVEKNKKWTMPVFILSLALIGALSYVLVLAAENLATVLGIPAVIIALTVLAGGSSIPEMIGSVIVSKQGRGDMAISNAIGSNVFDILISLGLPVLLFTFLKGPLETGGQNISSSVILLFVTLIMVLGLLIAQKFKADRFFGTILLVTYALYVLAAYSGLL